MLSGAMTAATTMQVDNARSAHQCLVDDGIHALCQGRNCIGRLASAFGNLLWQVWAGSCRSSYHSGFQLTPQPVAL